MESVYHVKGLCTAPIGSQNNGSTCLGWRSGVPVLFALPLHKSYLFQIFATFEAPAEGQAGAARRCHRPGRIRKVARYAEVFVLRLACHRRCKGCFEAGLPKASGRMRRDRAPCRTCCIGYDRNFVAKRAAQ